MTRTAPTVELLQVEPTTRCNFTCGFCAGRAMPQSDLDPALFSRALASFPALRHVELQGEGESLMHPEFLSLVGSAREKGIKVSFITNGSLLGAEAIERLFAVGVEKISVSIESADADTFRSIRGGRLDKVERNLGALLDERRRRGLDRPVVGLSVTVLRSTQDHLAGIVALYERLGLDGGITVQPLERKDDYARHYDAKTAADLLSPREVETAWIRARTDRSLLAIEARRPPVRGFFDELMEGWEPGCRRCPWLDRGLYLGNQGHAAPCCMVKDVAAHAFGRLGSDGVEAILAGREHLRAKLAAGEIPAACAGCDLAHFAITPKWKLVRVALRGVWNRLFGRLPE